VTAADRPDSHDPCCGRHAGATEDLAELEISASEDLAELLRTAEDAVVEAVQAYMVRANKTADPTDWRVYTYMGNARRLIAAAMVTAGMVEVGP